MEPIENKKKGKITFLGRKQGLIKKAIELSTLCDVNVSMIIFTDNDQEPPEIFPPDPHKFKSLIDLYRQKRATEPKKIGSCNVSDFFTNRKIKIEEELAKNLQDFELGLDGEIDRVKAKIESLKKVPEIDQNETNTMISMNDKLLLKFVEERLMKEDDDVFNDYDESLVGFLPPPLPLGCSVPPPMPADEALFVTDIPSQFMDDHQCDLIINQPSANPTTHSGLILPLGCSFPPPMLPPPEEPFFVSDFSSQMEYNDFGFDFVTEMPMMMMMMMMSKDVKHCCNYDRNFNVQSPPVVYSFPPSPPQTPPQTSVEYSFPPPPPPPHPAVSYSFPLWPLQQPEATSTSVNQLFMFG